jgi:outer membrane protein assembly factor BamB
MSRTIRCIGLVFVLASLMLSSAILRAPAQDKDKEKAPAKKDDAKPAPPAKAPPAPKVAPPPRPIGVPLPATKTGDPRYTDDVTIPTDRESKRLIQAAQDYIKKKEWQVVCESLQSLLDGKEDSFLEVTTNDADGKPVTRRVSVRAEANRLIGELPADGLEFYQVRYGPAAEARLKEALEKNDPAILADVALKHLHTKAGLEAANLLGTYHLDRGNYLMAALCFERLLARPDADKISFKVLFKAALAYRRAGDTDNAEKLWKKMADRAARSELVLGKTKVTVEQLRAEYDRAAGLLSQAGLHDWPMFRGNAARSAQGIGGTAYLEPRWQASMLPLDEPGQVDATNWIRHALAAAFQRLENKPILPTFFPIAANGKLIYRTYDGVYAVSLKEMDTPDGKVKPGDQLWATIPAQGGLHTMANRADKKNQLEMWFNTYYLNQQAGYGPPGVLFENSTIGALSHDNQRVYFVDDLSVPPHPSMMAQQNFGNAVSFQAFSDEVQFSRLTAVDLETGKLVWTLGGRGNSQALNPPVQPRRVINGPPQPAPPAPEPDDKRDTLNSAADLTDTFFLGPPLPLSGKLYQLAEKNTELKLICLDPNKLDVQNLPEIVWQQSLGTSNRRLPQDSLRRMQAAHIAYGDGILVCPTNAGVMLGVDLLTHSLVWAHSYRDGGSHGAGDESQPGLPPGVIMRGGRMMRNGYITGLPAQERWRPSAPIINAGRVIFTAPDSSAVHCLNLRDGHLLWTHKRQDDDLYLAGVFDGRAVIVGKTQVRALNAADGKVLWDKVPTGSLPTGQGAACDDVLFIPIQKVVDDPDPGPGVLAINLVNGKKVGQPVKAAKKEPVGNLLFVDGEMISQTALTVAAFPELKRLLADIDRRLKDNPNDPVGLTERGSLRLNNGDLAPAIDDFRTALRHKPPDDTRARGRNRLHEALTELFQNDFAGAEKYLDEYRELCKVDIPPEAEPAAKQRLADEQLRREANFLSLLGRGREKQGRLLDAFAAYEQFGALTGNKELVSVVDEKNTKSRPDVWSRGRIKGMLDRATPEQRKELEAAIEHRYQAVRGKNDVDELRKFVSVFGAHFQVGRAALLDLAEKLIAAGAPDDLTEAEARLKTICFSPELRKADPTTAAKAVEAMTRVYIRRGLYEDVVGLFKQLGNEFASVTVRDGKTGADFLNELFTDKRFLPYLEAHGLLWKGAFKAQAVPGSYATTSMQTTLTIEPEGELLPFFERHRLVLEVNQHSGNATQLKLLDRATNEKKWEKTNLPTAFYFATGQPRHYAFVQGHTLVLQLNNFIYAYDVATGKEVWKYNLNGATPMQFANAQQNITLDPTDGRLTLVYNDNRQEKLGSVALVEPSFAALLTREGLVALDLNRPGPSVLWTKSDVSVRAEVFGDDEHVYVVESNGEGGRAVRALRAQDGVAVSVPDFGPLFGRKIRTLGRCLLLNEEGKDGNKILRLYDVQTAKDVWRREFAPAALVTRTEDPQLTGVVEGRNVTVLTSRTGEVLFKTQLQADHVDRLQEVTLLGDRERLYLALSRAPEPGVTWNPNASFGLRSLKINGPVYALNRKGGAVEWVCDFVPHQWLMLEQVRDLPILLFASQYNKTATSGSAERMGVKVTGVDKRTGKLLYDRELAPHQVFHALKTDPQAGTIELIRADMKIAFRLEGRPVPASAAPTDYTPSRFKTGASPGAGK